MPGANAPRMNALYQRNEVSDCINTRSSLTDIPQLDAPFHSIQVLDTFYDFLFTILL
ncbi:hypothetical protein QCA50_005187 [Cerrena zonata]|uniref:Uncharacterized protein n=1 Tax=Cerrena zonata TaxID=2478898 RepID=A0AAW0GJ17_9APHY